MQVHFFHIGAPMMGQGIAKLNGIGLLISIVLRQTLLPSMFLFEQKYTGTHLVPCQIEFLKIVQRKC